MTGNDWFRYRVDVLNGAGKRVGVHSFQGRDSALEYGDSLEAQGLYGFEVVDRETRQVIHYGAGRRSVVAS